MSKKPELLKSDDVETPNLKLLKPNMGRILIVDDDFSNRVKITVCLQKLGFNAWTASNGIEALTILEKQSFDLILMDCEMPKLNGFQATHMIRKSGHPELKKIPIIAFTAGDKGLCLEMGMDDYLAKPFVLIELLRILDKWLGWILKENSIT
jgi:CheY-like chemotaxis protein